MRRILYCWATEIYKKKKIQAHCSEELPTTQATGVCPPRRAGRGCIILRMPRRPQSTCMALECTGGITRLSGFLRVHVPKSREASLWGTFGTFSFLEFSRGLEKPGKFHSSYFCLPLPHSPHSWWAPDKKELSQQSQMPRIEMFCWAKQASSSLILILPQCGAQADNTAGGLPV